MGEPSLEVKAASPAITAFACSYPREAEQQDKRIAGDLMRKGPRMDLQRRGVRVIGENTPWQRVILGL